MSIEMLARKLFNEVRANDDRLGQYADYEGSEFGPTSYLWGLGYAKFKSHCMRAVKDHKAAIATMEKLHKLNETRKPNGK